MTKKRLTYVLSILLVSAGGLIAGLLTREGTQLYANIIRKPPLSPPGILFPIVWTVLYFLMGISLARMILSKISQPRNLGILFFLLQYALNLGWCFIFFGSRNYALALAELLCMLASAVVMTVFFHRTDPPAAKLQIPYLLWLCFAVYLNIGVLILN